MKPSEFFGNKKQEDTVYRPWSNPMKIDATSVVANKPLPTYDPIPLKDYGKIEEGPGISMLDKFNRQPIVELAQKAFDNPMIQLVMMAGGAGIAREGLKRAVGRVATNILYPEGYGGEYAMELLKGSTLKQKFNAVKNDIPLWSTDPTKARFASGEKATIREFPYRKMFGLKPRAKTEDFFIENADGTYKVALGKIDVPIKDFYGTKYSPAELMGNYKYKEVSPNLQYYRDRWDFELNPGESIMDDPIRNVPRKLVSMVSDPITFSGVRNIKYNFPKTDDLIERLAIRRTMDMDYRDKLMSLGLKGDISPSFIQQEAILPEYTDIGLY